MVMDGSIDRSQTEQKQKKEKSILSFDNSPLWSPNPKAFCLADRFKRQPK
jgi:hypothetical protein